MSIQRIAMITGSSQGLGFEVAKVLNQNDLRLILIGRSFQKLETALKQFSPQKNPQINIHPKLPRNFLLTSSISFSNSSTM